jgi:CrcB protein
VLPPPRLLLAVAVGGAVGSLLRWTCGEVVADGSGFPWTTFSINVAGCALLAGLELLPLARRSSTWAAALGPGVMGGFTTLSTASEQARQLMADDRAALAAAYVLGTLAAALVAVNVIGLLAPPIPDEDEL